MGQYLFMRGCEGKEIKVNKQSCLTHWKPSLGFLKVETYFGIIYSMKKKQNSAGHMDSQLS